MMIEPALLISFVFTCLIIELTPGPNMAYLAILASRNGRRAGFSAVGGVALGLLLIGLATALGLATIISNSAFLYQLLRWGGVAYLLWLAWEGWHEDKETSPSNTHEFFQPRYFYRGVLTNLLNPKAALFYVAILPGFISDLQPIRSQAIILTITNVAIATLIHSAIVILADASRKFFGSHRQVYVRRGLSILLALVAIWFAWKTGNS